MFNLENLVRENIKRLTPYSSARKEFTGVAQVFLDANENSFGSPLEQPYNRYPDPLQLEIKSKISILQNVSASEIFIGNGSDEAIDLLFRIFCEPKNDNVLICPPTYGMYEVSAEINDVEIKRANLTADFQLDSEAIENEIDENTKLLFICSPNNPTGNALGREEILKLANIFQGIIVVDEAYIHFSREKSLVSEIRHYPNLVILQTFSKAWGLAGLRVGLAFANKAIIEFFYKVKPPYNVSKLNQEAALESLENQQQFEENKNAILLQRKFLHTELAKINLIKKIYPTDANFMLVEVADADKIYNELVQQKVITRNRNSVVKNCIRITVGSEAENLQLIKYLKEIAL